jgi:membrane protein YdbS with pleckstrin-like domain
VNWFNLSFIGWLILIIAIAIAAYMFHAPPVWIAIGALALIGIGIISSVSKSKPKI